MALMKYREANHVKWQGVRPGHDGTQIERRQYVVAAVGILYVVPAGKTFHLTFYSWAGRTAAGPVGGQIYVRTAVPATVFYIADVLIAADGEFIDSQALPFPIEVGENLQIVVESVGAGFNLAASIFGWIE